MQLDNNQQEQLMKWLNSKWTNRLCATCGGNQWQLSNVIFEEREFQGGNLVVGGGALVPYISATCNNCGHMIQFNALKMGIIKNNG